MNLFVYIYIFSVFVLKGEIKRILPKLRIPPVKSNAMTTQSQHSFRQAFHVSKELLHWYPGHMEKAMSRMQTVLKSVDCVVEVHDARIAISGRNPNFVKKLLGIKPHILVLNKVDLIRSSDMKYIEERVKQDGVENVIFTNCLKHQTCRGMRSLVPKAIDLIAKSDRYNRQEERDLCMMVIGIPNVGKSSIINALRNRNLSRGMATLVGPQAGVTRSVLTKIKVNVCPNMFLIDTPGILPPKIPDNETGMKLALCACLKDSVVTNIVIADFILYWLNKIGNFSYVDEFLLNGPCDEIIPVLQKIAVDIKATKKVKDVGTNTNVIIPDMEMAAMVVIKKFRSGVFGRINLDAPLL